MAIVVPYNIRKNIDDRQRAVFDAIRKTPIYDSEIYIPTHDTDVRCLGFVPDKIAPDVVLPVVFDIHGGGFTNGYPEEDDYICRRLSDHLGIRVFSIDYRLAPDHPYPDGLNDCYNVVLYIKEHCDEFGISPEHMVILGHSAGGNLAAVTCIRSIETGDFSFKGLILDYPPLDFTTSPWDKPIIEGSVPPELAEAFDKCYSEPDQRSDHHVSPFCAPDELISRFPPTTVMTAEFDSLKEEAEEFGLRLARSGVEVTVKQFKGVAHGFTVNYTDPASEDAYELIESGVRRYLGL